MCRDSQQQPGNRVSIGCLLSSDGLSRYLASVLELPGWPSIMPPDGFPVRVEKFCFRCSEDPGQLLVCASLADVNLRSGGGCFENHPFPSRSLEVRRDIGPGGSSLSACG